MDMKIWVGMAGLRGCLPNYCDYFLSPEDAVESLCLVHDIGPYSKHRKELRRCGFTELRLHDEYVATKTGMETGLILHGHGNEYAEIVESTVAQCDITKPNSELPDDINYFLQGQFDLMSEEALKLIIQ